MNVKKVKDDEEANLKSWPIFLSSYLGNKPPIKLIREQNVEGLIQVISNVSMLIFSSLFFRTRRIFVKYSFALKHCTQCLFEYFGNIFH